MTRVIGGVHRGRRLKTPEGMRTRPTTDRLKESLFGMIQFRLSGVRFLDLFAGSGQIGIEALSRGAESCVFVEKASDAVACIQENLRSLGLQNVSRVLRRDVETAVSLLSGEGETFDFIFMDPPYEQGWEEKIGRLIESSALLSEKGMLVVESSSGTEVRIPGMNLIKEKTYKTTRFSFFTQEDAGLSTEG